VLGSVAIEEQDPDLPLVISEITTDVQQARPNRRNPGADTKLPKMSAEKAERIVNLAELAHARAFTSADMNSSSV
jgi:hypothetical protein